MRTARYIGLIGLLLALVGVGALACTSDSEPALDETQLRSIVEDAVAKSAPEPQQQVSAEEIRTMVEASMEASMMDMASSQVSAQEIKAMVEASMMDMASSQVSAQDIQRMVEGAVASAAGEGASAQEIQTMVQSAVQAVTADAVTGADVQAAISKAVMEAQEGMVTSQEIQAMVEKAVANAAMEGASAEEVQAMVESAVNSVAAGAVTSEDVAAAVSKAVMEAQEGMVTSDDVQAAISSAVMQAAENSLTADEIEQIVSKALDERAMMEEAPRETIVFSDLNWTSAQVQNRVAQYIVEHGYGYPTDVIFGGTLPNFQGLQKGDIHVTLEIWLPNQSIGWEKAVEIGDVVSVGTSLVGDWQSTFVIPKYIADAHPDLKTPQDLLKPEYQELFATPDSRGKARLVACVPTWSCSLVNTEQIDTYGLADHLHVIAPGDQSAMFAEVFAAFEKEEPWLGYMWGTGDPALKLDLVRLQEEPFSEECWDSGKACAFADSLVLIAVHKSLLPRAPDVIGMLQNWEFSIDLYKSIFQYMDANEGVEPSDAAVWFLNNNKIWETWVTPEAAAAVNAALASDA